MSETLARRHRSVASASLLILGGVVRLNALLSPYRAPSASIFCGQGVPSAVLGGLLAARGLWRPTGSALPVQFEALSESNSGCGLSSPHERARRSATAERPSTGVGHACSLISPGRARHDRGAR